MERDPVRFVWRSAPGLNICLLARAFLAVPSLWVVLDMVRAAIDDAALGRAFRDGQTGHFLHFALPLPHRIADEPLVIAPGFSLMRPAMVQATVKAGKALAPTSDPVAGSLLPTSAQARAGADLEPEPAWSSR